MVGSYRMLSDSMKYIFKIMFHKGYAALFIVLDLAITIFGLIEPMLAQRVVDSIFKMESWKIIQQIILIWLILFTGKYLCRLTYERFSLKYSLNIMHTIQMDCYRRLLYAPLDYFKSNSSGYILSRQLDDVSTLDGVMLNRIISGILAIIEILIICAIMLYINPILAGVSILLKGFELYMNFHFPLKKLYKNHNEAKAMLGRELQDALSNIRLIKLANKFNDEVTRHSLSTTTYYDTRWKRDRANYLRRISNGLSVEISSPLIIMIGGYFAYREMMSWGDIMAFMLYFQKINISFSQAISLVPLYKISAAAADRIYETIQNTCKVLPPPTTIKKLPIKQSITLYDVSFSYDSHPVLKNINMQLKRGMLTGIFGVSGAGKSTLISLLLRELSPDSGTIKLDNIPISTLKTTEVKASIAVLTQEPLLFQRTIKENLLYHAKDCSDDNLWNVLKITKSEQIVRKYPDGLNTEIQQNGQNISGGERQRLCIAREILKDADVFIFDEATSALDATSEQAILEIMHHLAKTKIVIVISHSFEIMKEMDTIYVLDKGHISEHGSHRELCEHNGLYHNLFMAQR